MKPSTLLIGVFILLLPSFHFCNNPENQINQVDITTSKITGQIVADTLMSLGYFKYADKENIDSLKTEVAEAFNTDKVLSTIDQNDKPYTPLCFRLYGCDGEDLFEYGGIPEKLKDIKPLFTKLEIPLEWKDDWYSDDGSEHTIILNGEKYFAFKGDPNDMRTWGWATKFFVEMINDQLSMHESDERLYPIMGGNEGRMVFLTHAQYAFIRKHFDEKEGPLEISQWWKQN